MSDTSGASPGRAAVVALAVMGVATLHYTAGHGDPASAHHLYRRLFYVPILAAAWTWGARGGLVVAGAVVAVYLPHAFGLFGTHIDPASSIDKVAEMILYLGIGGLVGWFVDRERGAAGELRGLLAERDRTIEQRDDALEELRTAQDSLLQSEHQAALGFLTAGLAHEIRNPLGSIRGCAELLSDGGEDAQRERVSALLVRETERLDGVLTRFLRFARQERTDAAPSDIGRLVDEVVELVAGEASGRGVEVSHLRCSELPVVRVDRGGVQQVLLNLVVNALQVQEDGGTVRIVSGVEENGEPRLFVRVEDAGPGVPIDQRAAVFHPYYSTRPDGTGLGLAVSRRVLAEHGGTLQVEDASLGGASFVLRLPIAKDDGASP